MPRPTARTHAPPPQLTNHQPHDNTQASALDALLAEAEAFHEPKAKADAFDAWASYLDKLHSLFASSAVALRERDGPNRPRMRFH